MGDTNLLYTWSLLLIIGDCYVPKSAQLVLVVAREYDDEEVVGVMWKLAAMDAVEDARERCN